MFDMIVGALYVTYLHILMFNMYRYPVAQLKKLQHIFRNFERYKVEHMKLSNYNERHSAFVVFRECIKKHNKIIQ